MKNTSFPKEILMFFNSLAFLSGIMLLQNFSILPHLVWAYILIVFSMLFIVLSQSQRSFFKLSAFFILGFAWCIIYAHCQSAWVLPGYLEGKTIKITGWIVSIPEADEDRTSFLFSLDQIQSEQATIKLHGLVHLSWRAPKQKLIAGDEWQLTVRLKKIHGMSNPGGFDFEAWSLQQGIRATGYIYHDDVKLLKSHWYDYPILRVRQFIYARLCDVLPKSNTSAWIPGLALGIREGISSDNWQILRKTGTNHLMAIAGLHIGFMCSLIYTIFNWSWRQIPKLSLTMPAQHAGGIAAILMALIYSALAGFSLPTQRACFMLVIFFVIALLRRHRMTWHTWGLTLFVVLLMNPLNVLTTSFWLSFGAVAFIIYGMSGRLAPTGLWWKYGRIQWILTLGLIPLSIWFFQECSFVSFIANTIAIPWVGLLIVPLILLGCLVLLFSIKTGGLILSFADQLLSLLWQVLTYLSHLTWASWFHAVPNIYLFMLACAGMVVLLLPAGFPGRWLGLFGLLPFFIYKPLAPALGEAWITLLDVGQGLSAVIQTKQHILVFDTGSHLNDHFDMGESVVLPFLHTLHVHYIDMMVISHRDNDHSGGAKSIIAGLPVLAIKTSSPKLFSNMNASYCLQHERWQWDDVYFSFLYPTVDFLGRNNNSSCVLKIATKDHQLLLPGDIEKTAEKYLVTETANELSADILVAPHHGSKTSAMNDFIQAVHPKIVLFPVGYRNQYHFPNQVVVNQYKELGAKNYDSVTGGAIQIKLTQNPALMPKLYRVSHEHYWNDKMDRL
jgi:competence protein ComEC